MNEDKCNTYERQLRLNIHSDNLTEAKSIIKDYMIIVKGGNVTVCSVPEENRCINVLKLNEQAEQFLKEAGKSKWHKVADGDLPKDENDVLVYSGEDWRMCVGRYFPKYKAWESGCDTIAWCEIPKYTEE